jgi:hypothetical protein
MTGHYDRRMFGSEWEPATAKIVAKKFKEGGKHPAWRLDDPSQN